MPPSGAFKKYMYTRALSMVVIFCTGMGVGWLGKTWQAPVQPQLATAKIEHSASPRDSTSKGPGQTPNPTLANSNDIEVAVQNTLANFPQYDPQRSESDFYGAAIAARFNSLLSSRLYNNAIILYQEQKLQDEKVAAQLKIDLFHHLEFLQKGERNSDFAALIETYLSIYYDDIDVLLLLAQFKQINSSYLEVVDVYLVAKTYAYTDFDQEKVAARFNEFVEAKDSSYTNQKNWSALIDLYSHISTSGLMTSVHQYRQALAHIKSGDEVIAIEHLKQLLNDSLVGQSATITLNRLTGSTAAPATANGSDWIDAESIALQKHGNQYLVYLTNSRQDSVNLLIDTGASMTALSRESFDRLNANGDAVQQGSREFRTANGLVTGTVFSVPEINFGPYLLTNTQIAVIGFSLDRHIDGLLGMNVLDQFQFQIDQENSRLLLRDK